jgi:uncharacterized protein YndB with AHSA1/START domain
MAIRIERRFNHSPAAVWAVVGDPARTDWVPGVESCEFDGHVRRFRMVGAGALVERIVRRDDARRRLEYSVMESRPPLAEHFASIDVEDTPAGTLVVWRTTVDPVSVEPFIRRSMDAALDQLERVLAASG